MGRVPTETFLSHFSAYEKRLVIDPKNVTCNYEIFFICIQYNTIFFTLLGMPQRVTKWNSHRTSLSANNLREIRVFLCSARGETRPTPKHDGDHTVNATYLSAISVEPSTASSASYNSTAVLYPGAILQSKPVSSNSAALHYTGAILRSDPVSGRIHNAVAVSANFRIRLWWTVR